MNRQLKTAAKKTKVVPGYQYADTETVQVQLISSLKDAEAAIAAGYFIEVEPGHVELWLRDRIARAAFSTERIIQF
jgi:hypothetical protein